MEYVDVANSGFMFVLCLFPICVVIGMAVVFIVFAWREGKKSGLTTEEMRQVISSSAMFSIIPSVAVLLMLMALTFILGKYFPWLRLSVIGSGIYETMAANMSLSAFGLTNFSQLTLTGFVGIMLIMTVGILVGPILNIFLLKRYSHALCGDADSQSPFIPIMINAIFIGILVEWLAPGVLNFENPLGVAAMVAGLAAMLICTKIEAIPRFKKMESFSMSLSMIFGMAVAIIGSLIMKS